MDSRDLWETATLATSQNEILGSIPNDCVCSNENGYANYWALTVLLAVTYAYQVGLAYNYYSDQTTCRRIVRALLYMPLSIYYSVQYIFVAMLFFRSIQHLLHFNRARSTSISRENEQQQDQTENPASVTAANININQALPTTSNSAESVIIQIHS